MENRIKEQQLALFADRTSTALMRSNQLRLYFSSIAYCLMQALRRLGLKGTEMAQAQCGTIRLRLLKIGAQIRVSVRKVWISMSSGFALSAIFHRVYWNLLPQPRIARNTTSHETRKRNVSRRHASRALTDRDRPLTDDIADHNSTHTRPWWLIL